MREVDSRRVPIFRSNYTEEKHREQQLISLYRHTMQLVVQDSRQRYLHRSGSPSRRPATSGNPTKTDDGRDCKKSVRFRAWQSSHAEEKTFHPKATSVQKGDKDGSGGTGGSGSNSIDQNYFRASRPSHYIRYTYPTKFHPHPPTASAKVIETVPDCFRRSTAFSRMPFRQSFRQSREEDGKSGTGVRTQNRRAEKSSEQQDESDNREVCPPDVDNDEEKERNGILHVVHSENIRVQETSSGVLEIDVEDVESATELGEIKSSSDDEDEKSDTEDARSISSEKDEKKSSKSKGSNETSDDEQDSDVSDEYEEDFET